MLTNTDTFGRWPDSTTVADDPNRCPHCGCYHTGVCDRIKAIEYFPNGLVKRVEYHSAAAEQGEPK